MIFSRCWGVQNNAASMVKTFIPAWTECQTVSSIKQSDFQAPALQLVKGGLGKHGTTHLGKLGKMYRKV